MSSIDNSLHRCSASECYLISALLCRHCQQQYCINEVVAFIHKQADDANEQIKQLVDNVIKQIRKQRETIFTYIEYRRLLKIKRLKECLERFDKDANIVQSKLSQQILLSNKSIHEYRQRYADNMFDISSLSIMIKNEEFLAEYHYSNQLFYLREKWKFLQDALTTVYFSKKQSSISLDQILTFLEYRHDRVLENYRMYLSKNEQTKELSLKSIDKLVNELSFLVKREALKDNENFFPISISNDSS